MSRTIGLCLIVKNEAHIIERCLASVAPLVDFMLIVDTGSMDDTQDVVWKYVHENNIPAQILSEPWQNFAYNRTQAINLLKGIYPDCDYCLMIDADEVLIVDPTLDIAEWKCSLEHDIYDVITAYGGTSYVRPQLTSCKLDVAYRGVLHEFLEIKGDFTRSIVQRMVNTPIQDSARSKNPNKFKDDAKILEAALRTEKDPFMVSRYNFYLAQSYRDAGMDNDALNNYLLRATQGFWDQEIYISLLNAARIKERMQYPLASIVQTYMDAAEIAPKRIEALQGAATYLRSQNKYHQAFMTIVHGYTLMNTAPKSPDWLFVEDWVYNYGLLDELSINAYYVGEFKLSRDMCETLLTSGKLPPEQIERVIKNLEFANSQLPAEVIVPAVPHVNVSFLPLT